MSASRGYASRSSVRNAEYVVVGSQYEHVLLWRQHHGVTLDGREYIIHHKDHDKEHNEVCDRPAPCPIWDCGNLGAMTRADHIREHRPGRMGGRKIPNKRGKRHYYCIDCGTEKSKHGARCRQCAFHATVAD